MIFKNLQFRFIFFISIVLLFSLSSFSFKEKDQKTVPTEENAFVVAPNFKLSLAQWSIHRMIKQDGVDPYSFAQKASEWG
ncbi:MAG: hypothetical protein ACJA1V_000306, partial [Flavobacteriaceae bacterium]